MFQNQGKRWPRQPRRAVTAATSKPMSLANVSAATDVLVCAGAGSPVVPEGIASARFQVVVWAAYTATLVASVVGNCSVLAVVATQPHMRTVTNLFLANLALGDLLMTLLCVPFSSVSMFVLQYWPFGGGLCRAVNYCQAVSVLVSAYTLVALSADRYRAIMWPLRSRRRPPRRPLALLLIGAVWAGAAATALPIPLHSALVQPSAWHAHCGQAVCTEVWPDETADRAYSMVLTVAQFALPLATLVYTYACIGWRVWTRASGPTAPVRQATGRPFRRARRRTLRMTLAVVAAFVVCWLPFNVLLLAPLDDPMWEPLPYLWFVCHWLAMSHSCLNPLIYCYMNAKFRAGFRVLLLRPLGRRGCGCLRHSARLPVAAAGASGCELTPRPASRSAPFTLRRTVAPAASQLELQSELQ
uniref:G-protein coupled receptors family 1 profile domain-containing protein n=1 Tax=Anopheles dirus TaxID=7168 RepID=A0A182N054_9DIPT